MSREIRRSCGRVWRGLEEEEEEEEIDEMGEIYLLPRPPYGRQGVIRASI